MLIQYIPPSPRASESNNTAHVSREEGEAMIRARFARAIDDPDLQRAHGNDVTYPWRGYKVVNIDQTGTKQKWAVVFDSGMGERTVSLDNNGNPCVPGPTRVYRYDPQTGREGYELVPSDCPKEIIDQFKRLSGVLSDDARQAAIDARERAKFELEAQQKRADTLAKGFVLAHSAKG